MRAGLLGSALAVLTLAGHTAAGGALDALGIGIVAVLSTALAAALSTRALSLPATPQVVKIQVLWGQDAVFVSLRAC